ncbi:MAG: nucleoside-diphosphate-sugar epimerase [Patiriisocius sp.]|jgi:nucleoside-diphosphate-sugar epimerase
MSIAVYTHPADESGVLVVVGLGLIGQAISKQLSLHATQVALTLKEKFDWRDAVELSRIIKQASNAVNAKSLEIIWCAGKAGFTALESETDLEYLFFEQLVTALLRNNSIHLCVNLISSAGGLYENSGYVQNIESISPARPYANSKLAQESLMKKLEVDYRVYRVSTVYGFGGSRMGLISIMLRSSIIRTPMIIYADQNTLRDYIFNTDLAITIVNDVVYGADCGVRILASGRATSIHTLLNIVQKTTGRRVIHTFRPDGSNDQDITFSLNVIHHPLNQPLNTTNLEQGIKMLASQMLINDRYLRHF